VSGINEWLAGMDLGPLIPDLSHNTRSITCRI
jgi:hypothetical protein